MSQVKLPEVDFCLVCEDLRMEIGSKLSILGYYGALPRVLIRVQEWGKPIERLLFLINMHGRKGTVETKATIVSPDGTPLLSTDILKVQANTIDTNVALGFGFGIITFKDQGKHKFQVYISDQLAYQNTFRVEASSDATIFK